MTSVQDMTSTLTPRGEATRSRIVAATATLMAARGVAGTSLDDVRGATGTSKSQLYHYFVDKADLVRGVIAHQRDAVLAEQRLDDDPIESLAALHRWRYRAVAAQRVTGFSRACRLGRLAAELSDADEQTRAGLAAAFVAWQDRLRSGLATMVDRGVLRPDADPALLATGLLAGLQGGLLLSAATRDARHLQDALDLAVERVTAFAARKPRPSPVRPRRAPARSPEPARGPLR
jgi:TetR/AcrR family transcriptional regulator, transcriptional repressor for nem operon